MGVLLLKQFFVFKNRTHTKMRKTLANRLIVGKNMLADREEKRSSGHARPVTGPKLRQEFQDLAKRSQLRELRARLQRNFTLTAPRRRVQHAGAGWSEKPHENSATIDVAG